MWLEYSSVTLSGLIRRPFQDVVSSTVHIKNVPFFSSKPDTMSASVYERCPLHQTLTLNTDRILPEKLSELNFGVGLRRLFGSEGRLLL